MDMIWENKFVRIGAMLVKISVNQAEDTCFFKVRHPGCDILVVQRDQTPSQICGIIPIKWGITEI